MYSRSSVRKTTVAHIRRRKGGEPIVCLTAYTAMMAEILDPHVDILLVGDSLGMVLHGHDSTIPVTVDEMIFHARSVKRAGPSSLLVADLPFASYEESAAQAHRTAARVLKETGADAVKLEGGEVQAETIAFLTARGIPVMAHIGLRPQAVRAAGGYKIAGKTDHECEELLRDAVAVERAGAFAVVLECIVEPLARRITENVNIPTIGIGASSECDGQILVTEDLLGMFERTPKFVRRFADLRTTISAAAASYAGAVRNRAFPSAEETYADSNGD